MPPRKKLAVVEQPAPAIGHNSQETDDQLIAENHRLEDEIKAGQAKFNEWAKPRKDRIEAIETEIRKRLIERNADSTRTDSGTAYFSNIMNTKVEDMGALFDFVADHWDEADAKVAVPVATVRQYMDTHEGKPPPGLSISFYRRLNINRS
jgi:hypothetical protein